MAKSLADKSFVATIKCQVAGFEGYWDRHEVFAHPYGSHLPGQRIVSSYLTVNNFCNFPDVDESERCRFTFKCYALTDGSPAYQIFVKAGDEYQQLDVTQEFGYLRFYPVKESDAFWRIYIDGQLGGPTEVGTYRRFSMRPFFKAPWTYLGNRQKDGRVIPVSRKNDGKYWHAYFDADGHPSGGEMVGDLNVLKMG